MREMANAAFYGVTMDTDRDYATEDELIEYAIRLWESPPRGFQEEFAEYLSSNRPDPLGPLIRDDDRQLSRWD